MTDAWLIDKSAFVRLEETPDSDLWLERIDRGLVRIATVTLLEIGFSARSGASWNSGFANPPLANMPIENVTPRIEARAVEVQGLLARRGHHRAVKVPDLFVGATAELADFTVLHVDKDFDLIAKITGQRVERLRGNF